MQRTMLFGVTRTGYQNLIAIQLSRDIRMNCMLQRCAAVFDTDNLAIDADIDACWNVDRLFANS
jgi:hypothetical protein